MADPFQGFQQGLMTGAELGGRMRQNNQRRELGGLMASGDYAGAARTAYTNGDLQTGQTLDTQNQHRQIGAALQTGDIAGAQGLAAGAGDLDGMGQIQQWAARASEQERAAAARKFSDVAAVIGSVQSLPPEQQLAAAQRLAPQFGVDPSQITPESLTPQALEAARMKIMGVADYLTYQDRTADNHRQDATFAETQRHNRATEGVAVDRVSVSRSREARVGRGRAAGGHAGAAAHSGSPALPAGFTVRRR